MAGLDQRTHARVLSTRRSACGVPHQINRPSSMTPMRSPSAIASAMSCVTRITHLRDARLDAAELLLQLPARDRIERAERFVHQQHRRIGGERARHADALTLTA